VERLAEPKGAEMARKNHFETIIGKIPSGAVIRYILAVTITLLSAAPASAKILKTIKQALESQEQSFTIGSGLEFQTDSGESEFDFPLLAEYGITEWLKFSIEPSLIYIRRGSGPVAGIGDMETSVTYDFLAERRYRPGLSALGVVKWPIATNAELTTGKADYSLGLVASMAFVHADFDFNALYTFVGSPRGTHLKNASEFSLSTEWHLNRMIDLEGEFDAVTGSGGSRANSGAFGGLASVRKSELSENEVSATLGVAEFLGKCLKLEEGVIVWPDGSWQAVLAWEWAFGGRD
jgi:hypothetical protein